MIRIRQTVSSKILGGLTPKLFWKPSFQLTHKDERFLRFINFDADYLSRIPFWLQPLEPLILSIRDGVILANSFIGMPWWSVLVLSAVAVRLMISPLILVQMKRFSKLGPVAPALVFLKQAWGYSELGFFQKLKHSIKIYRDICKQEKFRLSTVFVYNAAYYPLLISMIFGIRKTISSPEAEGSTFLYITNFCDIDPYFILPTLTVALYYYNFQRYITPENEKTLMTKVRRVCQMFLILWFPFLCSWPAGIVLYMCSNALVSVIQSSIMQTRWFIEKMNQKTIMYTSIMQTVEYDKGTSEGIIQGIRKGQQNFDSLSIKEAQIEKQTVQMLKNLQKDEEVKQSIEEKIKSETKK